MKKYKVVFSLSVQIGLFVLDIRVTGNKILVLESIHYIIFFFFVSGRGLVKDISQYNIFVIFLLVV